MRKSRAAYTVKTAVIAALICVSSLISIPFPVPFTMQTFAVFFALYYLGGVGGVASVSVYIAIGALGVPVYSGFSGGVGRLFDLTGGYIWGFLLAALVFLALERVLRGRLGIFALSWLCLAVVYAAGTLQFVLVSGDGGVTAALLGCVLPFVIPDIIKIYLAYKLSEKLKGMTRK